MGANDCYIKLSGAVLLKLVRDMLLQRAKQ